MSESRVIKCCLEIYAMALEKRRLNFQNQSGLFTAALWLTVRLFFILPLMCSANCLTF